MISQSLLLVLLPLVLLPLVSAFPLELRDSTVCAQFGTVSSNSYSLLSNHWGQSDATSGSQCSTLESVHRKTVSWSTEWSWEGGNNIKSFSNIQLDIGINQQLSAITSMPSTWKWSQDTEAVVADVTYDLFTSYTAGGSNVNELMVWLANFNAKPISYEYSEDGQAIPIASNLAIGGHTWNLYLGFNGSNNVYSFLLVSGSITSFSGDIYKFFTYLIDKEYVGASEYLVTAQAGTEVTSGTASFKTSAYSLTIN